MDRKQIEKSIADHEQEIRRASHQIWDAAELAFTEEKSAEVLCGILERNGFAVERNLAGIKTAFKGTYGTGSAVIGFLGECDALSGLSQEAGVCVPKPIKEGGAGHGCGHNLLGAASLDAAIACKEYLEQMHQKGTVIYFGCPGEEGGSGKAFMAKNHVFDSLDIALTWHPGTVNSVSSGSSLANIQAKYHFYGVSAHAASCPYLGRSALDAVELMNVGANYLREHIIPDARLHYAVTNTGGSMPGVVQSYGEVIYLIRAPKINQVQEIYERVNDIARGAALMTGTRVEIDFMKACSDTVPNCTLEQELYQAMKETPLPSYTKEEMEYAARLQSTITRPDYYGETFTEYMDEKEREKWLECCKKPVLNMVMPYVHEERTSFNSTDVGDVSHVCPTAQIGTATWVNGTAVHTWQAASQGKGSIAEKGAAFAAEVLAACGIRCLENPEIINKAKKEFEKRTGGIFHSPIPDGVHPRKMN